MDGAGSFTAYCQESTRLHAIRRKCNRFPGHLADAIDADRHVRARVSEAKFRSRFARGNCRVLGGRGGEPLCVLNEDV